MSNDSRMVFFALFAVALLGVLGLAGCGTGAHLSAPEGAWEHLNGWDPDAAPPPPLIQPRQQARQ